MEEGRREAKNKKIKKMLDSRRRHPMDYYSSCSSSNKKRVDHLVHHPLLRPPTHATSAKDGDEDSEMLVMMAEMGGGRRVRSSFGSCGVWSMGSLMDHRPITPSPVCSPVSSLSCSPPSGLRYYSQVSTADDSNFATPDQSCVVSNDNAKESTSREEVEEAEGRDAAAKKEFKRASQATTANKRSQMQKRRAGGVYSNQACTPNANHTATSANPRRFSRDPVDSSEVINHDDGRRLPIVSEEQDERVHTKNWHAATMSPRLSSDGDYYLGGSGSASVNDNSGDDTSAVTDRLRPSSARFHSFVSQERRSEMEAKLIAWKEAQMLNHINKLRKQEVAIEEWERKQIGKAKQSMKLIETKLEKERTKAMNKMQRKILITQKKAEKKKLKEHAAATQKISKVIAAFEKISRTGKLPWKLVLV
ncbi:uncharacterized protein [Typha angustifolia]|uniref:uncharacterized protein isoform X1 n=1 Tax=Typha angustifolia TaxID=59011 RepID=UPI003C2F93E2